MLCGFQDTSLLPRDQTQAPAVTAQYLSYWTIGEFPFFIFKKKSITKKKIFKESISNETIHLGKLICHDYVKLMIEKEKITGKVRELP